MNKRIKHFDIAKGILIIMMVIGHVFLKGPIHRYIYTFHMPAFFIISGILSTDSFSSPKPLIISIRKKIYTLIIPLLFFECIAIVTECFYGGPFLNLKGYLFNTLTTNFNYIPNWFLFALFFSEVILLVIQHWIKNMTFQIAVIISISILLIFSQSFNVRFGEIGVGLLFLSYGYYLGKYYSLNTRLLIASFIISVIVTYYNSDGDLRVCHFNNVPLYILGAIAGTYFIIGFSQLVENRVKLLNFYGQNTLTILGTHQFLKALFLFITHSVLEEAPMMIIVSTCLFILIAEIPIIILFNNYLPFFIGRQTVHKTQ